MQEFNIDFIRHEWEYIRRRIRTVPGGAKVAALLAGCSLIDLDESYVPPLLIIRAQADFHYRNLLPFIEEDVLSWAIEMTMGVPCQVNLLPPASKPATKTETGIQPADGQVIPFTQEVIKIPPARPLNWSEPLNLLRIQKEWKQIKGRVREEHDGVEIAAALAGCQPIALEVDEYPPTLVLQAISPTDQTTLASYALDGSLMLAMLNALGHVCRMKILAPG
ncbi:hypothetical protein [Dictyobacter kobayashii]|nr:hypothetical protein [Dictyobacter kobayashii]